MTGEPLDMGLVPLPPVDRLPAHIVDALEAKVRWDAGAGPPLTMVQGLALMGDLTDWAAGAGTVPEDPDYESRLRAWSERSVEQHARRVEHYGDVPLRSDGDE